MVSRRRFLAAASLPVAASAGFPLAGAAAAGHGTGSTHVPSVSREVTAISYNLGLGTTLFDALTANSVDATEVYERFYDVTRSGVPERMTAIARLVEESGAALVGLQEVSLVRRGPRDVSEATEVVVDFLEELRAALAARDAGYRVAVASRNADEQLPADPPGGPEFDVRLTDRDIVLVRSDVAVTGTETRTYAVNLSTVVGGTRISADRGYALAECDVAGVPLTFVATHLEAGSRIIRRAQAEQLVGELSGRSGALVVAADVNSSPMDAGRSAYEALSTAYRPVAVAETVDGAADEGGADDGGDGGDDGPPPTCCQRPTLRNEASRLSWRLDEVFVAGPVGVRDAWRVGASPASRVTVDGERLWPSDHEIGRAHV